MGDGDAVGVGVCVAVAVGEGDGVGVGVAVPFEVTVGEGVDEAVGVGCGEPAPVGSEAGLLSDEPQANRNINVISANPMAIRRRIPIHHSLITSSSRITRSPKEFLARARVTTRISEAP